MAVLGKFSKVMGALETRSEHAHVSQEWAGLSTPATFIISWEQPVGDAASAQTQEWISAGRC